MRLFVKAIQINSRQRSGSGRILALFASLAIVALMFTGPLYAQVDTGAILGTVTDSSGAAVPNATVTVQDEKTGLVLQQPAKENGGYTFNALKVGTYTVKVTAAGFEPEVLQHLAVNIQQNVLINVKLKPGQVTATVTVNGGEDTLQTQDPSVGQVVNEYMIDNIPLNGRNYTLLAQLAPGTTTTVYDSQHGELESGSFTANGVTTTYNNYLLDGITNNNMTADFGNGNSYTLLPPPDALAEFKVETGDYSAEYGRSGGAVINAVTKSGQNTLFGDLWEFNRNAYFDANDYFLNKAHQPRPKFNRNQFGFSLGGPVVLPHFDGYNRLFFFVDYSALRMRQGEAFTSSVPTQTEQQSNFTDYSDLIADQSGTQTDILGRTTKIGQIFDPATTRYLSAGTVDPSTGKTALFTGYVRDPFTVDGTPNGTPTNVIPRSRISPVAAKLLSLYPQPNANGASIVNNYVSAPVLQQSQDTFDTRVDQNISSKDQMFERGSFGYIPRVIPNPCPSIVNCGVSATNGTESDVILGLAVGETHIFSPTMLNEFRLGYNRIHMDRIPAYGNDLTLNQKYGIPGIPASAGNGGLAQIKISGLSEMGEHNNAPLDEIGAESTIMDNISLERGKHSIRFGVDYERMKNAINSAQFPHGWFNFGGGYANQPNVISGTKTAGGNSSGLGIAQFAIEPVPSAVNCPVLHGVAASGSGCDTYDYVGGSDHIQGSPMSQQDYRRPYFGAYFQDNWKMLSRLTVNLGLRWEYFADGVDRQGHAANFVPGFANHGQAMYLIDDRVKNVPLSPTFLSLMQQENIAVQYTSNHQLRNFSKANFGPRLGFEWQMLDKTVLRGGYAISYAGIYARGDGYNPGDNYPFSFAVNITSSDAGGLASDSNNAIGPIDQGLAGVPLNPSQVKGYQISPRGNQYNVRVPYVESMNLSLQQQLAGNQYVQIAYVGTLNRHIESNIGSNRIDMMLPVGFSVSPVSPGPTCNDAGLYHDVNPNNPNPTAEDKSVYYDQYPCLSQNNYYLINEGSNNYNSLQVKYEKISGNGTALIADYTHSRFLGYGSDSNLFNSLGYRGPFIPNFGMKGEYGPEDFQSENVVHMGGVLKLPFGRNQRWLNGSGVVDTFIGGWSLGGVFTYQSGQPVTVNCRLTYASGVGCYAIPDWSKLFSGAHTVNRWLNPNAYSEGTNGASTPNVTDFAPMGGKPGNGVGPAFHRGDLTLQKTFHLPFERTNLIEIRGDAFNLTNTPNFGQPGTLDLKNSKFSQITSERDAPNDSREFQFSVRYIFGRGGQQ